MDTKHVFVLEDEPATRMLLEEILKAAGYRVSSAADGTIAYKMTRDDPPDLVVSDLSVPGLDGFQLVQMIKRKKDTEIPVVVVSGHTQEKDIEEATKAGADAFLPKPVNRDQLLAKVTELPLTEWRYKVEPEETRHLGPMAQDFHAAFGLGESDTAISTVDADGVALAAIQGLHCKLEDQLKQKDAEIAELKKSMVELRGLVNQLIEKEKEQ